MFDFSYSWQPVLSCCKVWFLHECLYHTGNLLATSLNGDHSNLTGCLNHPLYVCCRLKFKNSVNYLKINIDISDGTCICLVCHRVAVTLSKILDAISNHLQKVTRLSSVYASGQMIISSKRLNREFTL